MKQVSPAGQRLGATLGEDGTCEFRVWAPRADNVTLRLQSGTHEQLLPMQHRARGYFDVTVANARAGDHYTFRLERDGESIDRPDPASRCQVDDVHGASQIVARGFDWTDAHWRGCELAEYIFYELHIGTFTKVGTFDAAAAHLDELRDLGITAIELMPVAQFPGSRNWGYDGVLPFAVQNSYGGPQALKRFVNACHERKLAVVLDVVYNHLGPEGNYLSEFGDYFTDKYHTPWGRALNFDGPGSDEVRHYFIENALMWVQEYHIDALRLDAVHAIFDQSAYPFLHELTDAVHEKGRALGRAVHVIAESDLNDPRLIRPPRSGGFGMDAQWSDDVHHALHALITGERDGYYADFGSLSDLAKAISNGFVFQGQYSGYRQRRHGAPAHHVPARRFVVCAQNHDQVGNRALGERLRSLVSFEQYKVAAAMIVLSPFLPLLFMGEEYAETNPFQYFVSHSDPELVDAVRKGRAAEFSSFGWGVDVPDPQSGDTFNRSRLDRARRASPEGAASFRWYQALIAARKAHPPLRSPGLRCQAVSHDESSGTMLISRTRDAHHALLAFNLSAKAAHASVDVAEGAWRLVLQSYDDAYQSGAHEPAIPTGPQVLQASSEMHLELAPTSFALYVHAGHAR